MIMQNKDIKRLEKAVETIEEFDATQVELVFGLPVDKLWCCSAGGIISYKEMLANKVQSIRIVGDGRRLDNIREGVDLAIELNDKKMKVTR